MIGSFLTRTLVLILGYAYPAYECYKSVELNKPNIELLRFWCQYWILVAFMTVCERFGDFFIGWLPMYGEAKLAFIIYLWSPKLKGTTYVYNTLFRPYIAKHESDIDRHLLELRTRAGDIIFMYWQQSAGFVQAKVLEIMRIIISQSTSKKSAQPQDQATNVAKSTASSNSGAGTTPQNREKQISSPAASLSDNKKEDTKVEAGPEEDSRAAALNKHKPAPTRALSEITRSSTSSKEEEALADSADSSANENPKTQTVREMLKDEAGPFTRARLRKVNSALPDH